MNNHHAENDPNGCANPSLRALARYAAVSWITERMKDPHPHARGLSGVIQEAATRDWHGYRFSPSTLERHYYNYGKAGFAALVEQARSDAGAPRKLPPELVDVLLAERRAHPQIPVTVLLELLRDKGVDVVARVSASSVYRLLRQHGLDGIALKLAGADPSQGPQKAFEMPAVNMLWMTDMMHGPVLVDAAGRMIKSRLFAFLDDHSRLCPGGKYYRSEAFEGVLGVLRSAIRRRGIPEKIYTDCGKIYLCHQLAVICANLGVKLSHAQPYHAWSKGKIERFFRTVQQQFQTRLLDTPVHSLEELNERFESWLEEKYHRTVHSATGQTPAERFAAGAAGIRNPPDAAELDQLFLKRLTRRVRRDGCVTVEARLFEAPLCLRGMEVEIRHPLPLADQIEIWHQGKLAGLGKPVDKHFNATHFNRRTP